MTFTVTIIDAKDIQHEIHVVAPTPDQARVHLSPALMLLGCVIDSVSDTPDPESNAP